MLKRIITEKKGEMSLLMIAMLLGLLAFSMMIMEAGGLIERHDYVLSVLQRSCNSALEKNILDNFRQDRIIIFNMAQAEADFIAYVDEFNASNGNKYNVVITEIVANSNTEEEVLSTGRATKTPFLQIKGAMNIPSMFGSFTFDVEFIVFSTNYNTEGYEIPTH